MAKLNKMQLSNEFACPKHKKPMFLYERGIDINPNGKLMFVPWEVWLCQEPSCGRYTVVPEGAGPNYENQQRRTASRIRS